MERSLLVGSGSLLVFDFVLLESLVLFGLEHELLEGLHFHGFGCGGVGLQACEVRENHLEEVDNVPVLRKHALVGLREGLRSVLGRCLLLEGGGFSRLGIEVLQDGGSLRDGSLGGLGLLDRLLVDFLRGSPFRGGLSHRSSQLLDTGRQVRDVLGQVGDCVGQVLDLSLQFADIFGLRLASQLVGCKFRVAPALVLSFRGCFLHQLRYQVPNHLLDLVEGVGGHSLRDQGEELAVQSMSTFRQHGRNAILQRAAASQLGQGRPLLALQQAWQVLLAGSGHLAGAEDFDGLGNSL
mmetsp:Transcript_31438/g.47447  ORF Transcript_31438/g.47447 Transcript_31438/m.47447 type:complete len:295 (-) Transcript_31438:185-1069(-)